MIEIVLYFFIFVFNLEFIVFAMEKYCFDDWLYHWLKFYRITIMCSIFENNPLLTDIYHFWKKKHINIICLLQLYVRVENINFLDMAFDFVSKRFILVSQYFPSIDRYDLQIFTNANDTNSIHGSSQN